MFASRRTDRSSRHDAGASRAGCRAVTSHGKAPGAFCKSIAGYRAIRKVNCCSTNWATRRPPSSAGR